MKWGDVLRIKAEFPVNLWPNAAQAYHRWVRASIAANKPYDQFVREMLIRQREQPFRNRPGELLSRCSKPHAGRYRGHGGAHLHGHASGVVADQSPPLTLSVFFSADLPTSSTSEWKEEHVFWDPLGFSTVAGNSSSRPCRGQSIGLGFTYREFNLELPPPPYTFHTRDAPL